MEKLFFSSKLKEHDDQTHCISLHMMGLASEEYWADFDWLYGGFSFF